MIPLHHHTIFQVPPSCVNSDILEHKAWFILQAQVLDKHTSLGRGHPTVLKVHY